MNIRVAASLITAIVIAISTGSFVGRNACAAQVDDQENLQQSQHKMENKAAGIGKKLDELEQKMKTSKRLARADDPRAYAGAGSAAEWARVGKKSEE